MHEIRTYAVKEPKAPLITNVYNNQAFVHQNPTTISDLILAHLI